MPTNLKPQLATLVERPLKLRSLVSVVRAALRSRRHQYAIRDHLAERERMEAELREADRKKDDFIALLAHELRNPLAPIRNGLQILKFSGRTADPALGMMDRQLTHMVRLIDDLLDVSRIGRNKVDLRRARVINTKLKLKQAFPNNFVDALTPNLDLTPANGFIQALSGGTATASPPAWSPGATMCPRGRASPTPGRTRSSARPRPCSTATVPGRRSSAHRPGRWTPRSPRRCTPRSCWR